MKKVLVAVSMLFMCSIGLGQTARSYYNELYKAGGLDRMADGYVCFDDDPKLGTFFIFADSSILRSFLKSTGDFAKLPSKDREELNKGFLTVRGYSNGVPLSDEETFEKDDDSWVERAQLNKTTKVWVRLDISWQTLRYRKSVEVRNLDLTMRYEKSRYGRCEEIPPTIRQRAN